MRIHLKNVSAEYDHKVVLRDITAEIASGEMVAIVGASGSGKSTLLRVMAGLRPPSISGSVFLGDRDISNVGPRDGSVGFVFQDLALYPHLTVFDNIAMGLKFSQNRGLTSRGSVARRVREWATRFEIVEYLDRYPRELSGGQQQRVAIARAIIKVPAISALFLDEAFSDLDPALRLDIRGQISALQRELGLTTVYVTHDRLDAITIADRIMLMKDGVVQQFARPGEMFQRPANTFVGSFLGEFPLNLYSASVRMGQSSINLSFAGLSATVPIYDNLSSLPSERLLVGLRPESLILGEGLNYDAGVIRLGCVTVRRSEDFGNRSLAIVETDTCDTVRCVITQHEGLDTRTTLVIRANDLLLFTEDGTNLGMTCKS